MSARPALAAVLGGTAASGEWWWAVDDTTTDCPECEDPPHRRGRISCEIDGVRWQLPVHAYHRARPDSPEWHEGVVHPWSHRDPAEALAALVEAEALPERWCDPARAPRWWCAGCGVCGNNPRTRTSDGFVVRDECFACDDHGYEVDAPPSHVALVSVAALGPDALARAEAIVAETWPGARLVWRAMARAAIEEHHAKVNDSIELTPLRAFAHEMVRAKSPERFGGEPAWPRECPWQALSSDSPTGRAWPALHALAAAGLHPVALDAARVALAVEALC